MVSLKCFTAITLEYPRLRQMICHALQSEAAKI